jgi:large subunit ribosomal protein L15
VNLDRLNSFDDGSSVGEDTLIAAGLIRRPYEKLKILGGDLNRRLAISANCASKAAIAAIEKAGGSIILK